MVTPQIYTLKSPAQRVAAKLTGTLRYRCDYKCGCSRLAMWVQVRCVRPDDRSACQRCGAFRSPYEVWEE